MRDEGSALLDRPRRCKGMDVARQPLDVVQVVMTGTLFAELQQWADDRGVHVQHLPLDPCELPTFLLLPAQRS